MLKFYDFARKYFYGFLSDAADLICPPNCLACQKPLDRSRKNYLFCDCCCQNMIVSLWEYCPRCGAIGFLTPGGRSDKGGCFECRRQTFQFSDVTVLGKYSELLRLMILRMKHDRDGIVSGNMARLFLSVRKQELRRNLPDLITPIPMHFIRRFFRGVNNPIFFAKEIGTELNIPVSLDILRRTRYTEPQFNLKPNRRFSNVRGAFAFVGRKELLAGKHVLLVDDIMTTGATCNEAARVLREAGAASVRVAVYGRTMKEEKNHNFEKLFSEKDYNLTNL
ncbi:MAG: ComF family protein [Planctomycetaceae bacterium]|jgi:ComF family protein|nr:ComF family protein [Planctomycetaceae bacterium]